jgi:hypothetical protein
MINDGGGGGDGGGDDIESLFFGCVKSLLLCMCLHLYNLIMFCSTILSFS